MVIADAASTGGTVIGWRQATVHQNAWKDVTIMDMENGIMGMLSYACHIYWEISLILLNDWGTFRRRESIILLQADKCNLLKITGKYLRNDFFRCELRELVRGGKKTRMTAEFYADGGILSIAA